MPSSYAHRLFAERALLPNGWARDVAIDVNRDGRIRAVTAGASPEGRERLSGPALPALANLHSHSFQRAMAGLAEVSGSGNDSFWTWRDLMYRLVGRLTPEDVQAIAAKLFVETLKGGFASIAEFHYLHHAAGGTIHANPAEMSHRILAAAEMTGICLTLLPVFYAHADFGGVAPTPGQARFIHDVDGFLRLLEQLEGPVASAGQTLGLAFHSLRAATPEEMHAILAVRTAGPLHIHVAEQTREVEASLAHSGRRPVEFLADTVELSPRWCLIHATHMTEAETLAVARSGAIVGLCPATEANLGDGIFPADAYLAAGGRFGIGTDSHVATGIAEELRTLEYGQRLRDRARNRLASGPGRSVGRSLHDAALLGGATALGRPCHGFAPGELADITVLDQSDPYIAAARDDQILDRWIFARGDAPVRDVMAAGRWVIRDRQHERDGEIDRAFAATLHRLSEVL